MNRPSDTKYVTVVGIWQGHNNLSAIEQSVCANDYRFLILYLTNDQ